MKRLLAAVLVALGGLSVGCATIVSESEYPVDFSSHPSGADVTLRDENGRLVHRDRTPFQLTLEAHDGYFDAMRYEARFEKNCHDPVEASLAAHLDEWYWGNLVFGGIIGFLLLDPGTGAMWELDPSLSVTLPAQPQCEASGG